MMEDVALSMRPWPFEQDEKASVTTLLDRVNRERGHFREITGSSLQEELATEGALALSDSDDETSIEAGEETADDGRYGKANSREDLFRAKYEMLEKISYAHNEVMMALDFVSLLASKDSSAARQSMSQYLRENVPAGTLGSDIWKQAAVDPVQEAQNLKLAQNVRLEAFEKSADGILAAAKTLESNVKAEVQYWNQINAVTSDGWSLCRLPGQKHKLGVRFGSSESAPKFSQAGIAALDVDDDGDISVVTGVAARSKVLRVTIHRAGAVAGQTTHLDIAEQGTRALESRIRRARDSLFNDELFYEMERESRTLVSRGVRVFGSLLSIPLGGTADSSLSFELTDSKSTSGLHDRLKTPDDTLAQGVLCLAKLLLCRAHHDLLRKRSQVPPPLTEKTSDRPLLNILRPVMFFLSIDKTMATVNDRLQKLSSLLQLAGVENDSTPARLDLSNLQDIQDTEALTDQLLGLWSCKASLQLQTGSSPASITITTHTMDASTLSFVVQLGSDSILEFTTQKQALVAFDRAVSRMVALSIATQLDAGWKVDNVSASLTRDLSSAGGESQREACVLVDAGLSQPKLSLVWVDGRRDWISGQDGQESLLDVWKAVSSG